MFAIFAAPSSEITSDSCSLLSLSSFLWPRSSPNRMLMLLEFEAAMKIGMAITARLAMKRMTDTIVRPLVS